MVTNRNVYWDVWKGLAIVGVVLIHATILFLSGIHFTTWVFCLGCIGIG